MLINISYVYNNEVLKYLKPQQNTDEYAVLIKKAQAKGFAATF